MQYIIRKITTVKRNNIWDMYMRDFKKGKALACRLLFAIIFEEGWSEINHKLLYKNNTLSIDEEMLLKQASSILSSLAGDCDTLAELMTRIVSKEDEVNFIRDCNSTNSSSILEELIKGKKG